MEKKDVIFIYCEFKHNGGSYVTWNYANASDQDSAWLLERLTKYCVAAGHQITHLERDEMAYQLNRLNDDLNRLVMGTEK